MVGRVVGNFIGQIAQLRFQAGLGMLQKPQRHTIWLEGFKVTCMVGRAVLQNALTRLERQIESVKLRVTLLQLINHAQALQVVLKAAKRRHAVVQRVLPGMAKRRVTEIMRQRNGFNQVFVELQRTRNRAPELRHFQRMR